ncbi:hypothetical protein KP509_1Z148300 [Ceratopteris richardii]|nr:hypothetical protein KP509_1Z148300 [Ceratopteris richardii]
MECFQQMLVEGVILDSVGYACSLKAFSSAQNLKAIQEMHAVVIGLDLLVVYPLIGNTLMDAYICCASLKEAQKLFQKLQARDIVSWNTLVDGHIRQGHGEDALQWTGRMLIEGMSPDSVTLVCSLRACGITRLLCRGKNLHAAIALAEVGLLIGNALIDMYFKCGSITDAYKIFSVLKHRDVVSWTSLIAGYVSNGSAEESLICFQHMLADGIAPNTATFACVLKACGQMKAVRKGIEMHTEIERRGLSALDIAVGNALVDMYSKCDMLEAAFEVFDLVPAKNVASWNTLIAVYMKHGYAAQALDCLKLMLADGIRPNSITYISSLKACGYMGILTEGIELHTEIARNGLLLKDASVGNALVDMYIHHGLLTRAMEVFNELPDQSQICWTSLLAGFVEHDQGREALCFFDRMQLKGLSPDAATYVCSLKACRAVGAVNKGREIHAEVARCSLLGDELIGNSLIGMYADCGLLAIAHEVFDMLHRQNKVAWTALIAGHVRQGDLDSAILAFERMRQGKECPDAVTLLWILMAFAQAGEVERGQMYFETMDKVYGISPNLEHCTCIVDLFCRAGFTDMASALIEKMSLEVDPVVWCTFLDACQKSGNVEAGVKAFEHIVQIGAMDPSPKLSISNLHASIEEKETFIVVREKAGNEHMTYGGVNEEDSVLSLLEACL